jgi:hypothetical protein
MSQATPGQSPNSRFLAGQVGDNPTPKGRVGGAGAVSLAAHVGAFMLAVYLATLPASSPSPKPLFDIPRDIVWLQEPGPGGGGGGGGNEMPEPPRQAELPGKDKVTVPVEKPEPPKPEPPKEEPVPEQKMVIPAMTTTSGVEQLPGVIAGCRRHPPLRWGPVQVAEPARVAARGSAPAKAPDLALAPVAARAAAIIVPATASCRRA